MGWDFETDQEFQRELDWIENFVREEIEPLDFIVKNPFDLNDPIRQEIIPPLQKQVQERGLWACHLGPELGGPRLRPGQARAHERDSWASAVSLDHLWVSSTGHRQQRDPGSLRHRATEGKVPRAIAA